MLRLDGSQVLTRNVFVQPVTISLLNPPKAPKINLCLQVNGKRMKVGQHWEQEAERGRETKKDRARETETERQIETQRTEDHARQR